MIPYEQLAFTSTEQLGEVHGDIKSDNVMINTLTIEPQ